jgi:hypothetical protein
MEPNACRRRRRRGRPTPSMVVAFLALLISLGGTSYAVTKISPRSVGSRELKKNAVARTHIKKNAVNGAKVAANTLKGGDIDEASLAQVPVAARAATADRAGGLGSVFYRVATGTIPPAPNLNESTFAVAKARCDAGQLVVGGGARVQEGAAVVDSYPDGVAGWTVTAANDDPAAAHQFSVYALCIPAGSPG